VNGSERTGAVRTWKGVSMMKIRRDADSSKRNSSAKKTLDKKASSKNAASDGLVMTIDEIERDYDKQWVLVGNPVCAKDLSVKKGVLLWHGKSRVALYENAEKYRSQYNFAFLYVGERAGDAVYLL
jgi:hypothetical protein